MSGIDFPHGTSPNTVSMLEAGEGLTKKETDNLLAAQLLLNFLA